ncbi:MAG: patatin-like phospholipase family protein [bacterium]|nr:patatin-like phospholipase family protein [bacterium]
MATSRNLYFTHARMAGAVALAALLTLSTCRSAVDPAVKERIEGDRTGIRVLLDSEERLESIYAENGPSFFADENELIQERRRTIEKESPQSVGLGFSGGGIRAAAFHFGYLNALHENERINEVDYLSAVSGGSWAAGSYKAMQDADASFAKIRTALKQELNDNDEGTPYLLRNYETELRPGFFDRFKLMPARGDYLRETWRKMIRSNFLRDGDTRLREIESGPGAARPFLILNAAHSAAKFTTGSRPFEFTALSFGTIQNHDNNAGFFIDLNEAEDFPLYLSHAMAAASAVVYDISGYLNLGFKRFQIFEIAGLEWNYDLNLPTRKLFGKFDYPEYPEFPEFYVVTDGGHFENLAGFALLERGVKLIVLTDLGEDPDLELEDWNKLVKSASELLNIEIDEYDEVNKVNRYNEFAKIREYDSPVSYMTAKYQHREIQDHAGLILYIKPKKSDRFLRWLNNHRDYAYVHTFLQFNYVPRFPNDHTFSRAYSDSLIRAYFVLGDFVGKCLPECAFSATNIDDLDQCLAASKRTGARMCRE